jgi:hypothetical protein
LVLFGFVVVFWVISTWVLGIGENGAGIWGV